MRYVGQSFELTLDAGVDASSEELRELFEVAHEREYGYRDATSAVELVTVTASVWGPEPRLTLRGRLGRIARANTTIWHDGASLEVPLLRGVPAAGEVLPSPAILALPESTLLVSPGWSGAVRADGTIELRRAR